MEVNDGAGGMARQTFTITVSVADANRAPTISSLPRSTARAGLQYTGRVIATDPDGDPITISLDSGPAGMTLSPDGLFSWLPTAR